ncbi:hypothetical protein [Kaarinaea lacus]
MKTFVNKLPISLIFLSLALNIAQADVLELKDGNILKGQFMGGTQSTVRFQVNGDMKVVPREDIVAITFTGDTGATSTTASQTAPVASAPAAAASTSKSGKGAKSVPAGTVLMVRTAEEIGTRNKSAGDRFTTTLEGKLMAGDSEIAPSGATVHGRVIKSQRGGIGARKPILELTLTEIMIDGQLKPIKTNNLTGEGPTGGAGRKIAKGAAVGALADGSSGAETGAKIGAGIAILAGGKHAGLQNGTLLEFSLAEDFSL